MDNTPAYRTVRTKFVNNDYETICESFGGGFTSLPAWRALGQLLVGRSGWHFDFDLNSGEPTWSIGAFGEALLVVHVNEDAHYHCYDHRADADAIVADIPAVEAWLEGQEEGARRPGATLIEMARANGWQTLKNVPNPLRVSWSDGHFSATAYQLNEASFAPTLTEAINRAAEMICHVLNAPPEIALEMNLSAELDASAVRRLRTP